VDFSRLFALAEYIEGDQVNVPQGQARRWRVRAKDGPYRFIDPNQNRSLFP
jgi:hypothetical protein